MQCVGSQGLAAVKVHPVGVPLTAVGGVESNICCGPDRDVDGGLLFGHVSPPGEALS